jgi:hypothetical protein
MSLSSFTGGEIMDRQETKSQNKENYNRRGFLKNLVLPLAALFVPGVTGAEEKLKKAKDWIVGDGYKPADHYWGDGH